MIELAMELDGQIKLIGPGTRLPAGVIVGSAVIARCVPRNGNSQPTTRNSQLYEWHLADVQRASRPRKPTRRPQPRLVPPLLGTAHHVRDARVT